MILASANCSCSKDNEEPAFIGKWEYLKAKPANNVDECYMGTWFMISVDHTFVFYNSCLDEIRNGTWVRKGMGFQVKENGEIFTDFQGKLIELKNNRMLIETEMFGGKTLVEFIKVNESDF